MPIFEYRCQDCATRFEKLVRASDTSEILCPSCGKNRLEQQLSTFAAHSGSSTRSEGPSCPSAGGCPNAGMCGMN
jgi:putative FmdB family regulatory protein